MVSKTMRPPLMSLPSHQHSLPDVNFASKGRKAFEMEVNGLSPIAQPPGSDTVAFSQTLR